MRKQKMYIDLMRSAYRDRLKAAGIPRDPARRDADQAAHADLLFWAAKSEATLDVGSIDRTELEGDPDG
jgi:hypothetical protein